jgi:Domain of unknown function (DUF4360)
MRKISLALFTALLATACGAPPADQPLTQQHVAAADAGPGPAPAGAGLIEKVEYTGTGCEGNSAKTGISPDGQAVTSTFSAFVAQAGPGSAPAAAARNCLLMMQIKVPPGWSYSLESVDYRGLAHLETDVTASRQSLYVISGSPVHVTPTVRFQGELDDDYNQADISPEAPGVWSPCGGGQVLWIATQSEVKNSARPGRGGQLIVDSIDTELQWRRCQ